MTNSTPASRTTKGHPKGCPFFRLPVAVTRNTVYFVPDIGENRGFSGDFSQQDISSFILLITKTACAIINIRSGI